MIYNLLTHAQNSAQNLAKNAWSQDENDTLCNARFFLDFSKLIVFIISTLFFFFIALFRLDASFFYSCHFGHVPSLENCYLTPESASRRSSANSISAYSEPGTPFQQPKHQTKPFFPSATDLYRRKSAERYQERFQRYKKSNKYHQEYIQYLLGRPGVLLYLMYCLGLQ